CSQLVDVVEGADHKFFQATQVMDEARHNEVLDRYLTERLGIRYGMPKNERDLFDSILTESRWYLKTIALQLVAETFAVALFKMMGASGWASPCRRADRRQQLDQPLAAVRPRRAQLSSHDQAVGRPAERTTGQPVRHAVLDPGPAPVLQQPVPMLPARIRPVDLHVH